MARKDIPLDFRCTDLAPRVVKKNQTPEEFAAEKRAARLARRIRRSSGTTDRRVFNRYVDFLHQLCDERDHDLLRQIRDGNVRVAEAYKHRQQYGKQEPVVDGRLNKRIKSEFDAYIAKKKLAPRTTKSYRYKMTQFIDAVGNVPLGELQRALEDYETTPRTWLYTKDILSGVLRKALGTRSDFYRNFRALEPTEVYKKPKDRNNPQDIPVILSIRDQMPEQHYAPVMSMALTGMMPSELWENKWSVKMEEFNGGHIYYIHIAGEKTEFRDRIVPYLGQPQKPKTKDPDWFNTILVRAAAIILEKPFTCYDLRRSFELLLDNAGIPTNRQGLYMGHSPQTQTGKYGVHDVRPYVMEDQQRLLSYVKTARERDEYKDYDSDAMDEAEELAMIKGAMTNIDNLFC